MPIKNEELIARLNPSLEVSDDKSKNATSITIKHGNDELIRAIFKVKTRGKGPLFDADKKIIEITKNIDKLTDKEFKIECRDLQKSLQQLINHLKKIKKQKRIDSSVESLDQLIYELCCDTLYYVEKRDYFNFINATNRRIENNSWAIHSSREFQGFRYALHVITECFKYIFLVGFYLAYKRGGFFNTTMSGKVNQFLKKRNKFYINNDYREPNDPLREYVHTNCYKMSDPYAPAIKILQKKRLKKIIFDSSYFSKVSSRKEIKLTLNTIAQLAWTQVKELQYEYPIQTLNIEQINTLLHMIQKSAVHVLAIDTSTVPRLWSIAQINAFTLGLIGSNVSTLDLKINLGSWHRDAIQALVSGLQKTSITTLRLQGNNLENWNQEQCLTFATGLTNTKVSKLDLSLTNMHRWTSNQIQEFIEGLAGTPVRSIKLSSFNLWSANQVRALMTGLQKTEINDLEFETDGPLYVYADRLSYQVRDIIKTLLSQTKISYLKSNGWFLSDLIDSGVWGGLGELRKTKIYLNLSVLLYDHISLSSYSGTIDGLFRYIEQSQINSINLFDMEFINSLRPLIFHYNEEKKRYVIPEISNESMHYIINKLHQSKITEIKMILFAPEFDIFVQRPDFLSWLPALKLHTQAGDKKNKDQHKEYTLNLSGSDLAGMNLDPIINGLRDDKANKLKCCIGTLDLSNTNLNKLSYTSLQKLAIDLASTNVHTVILSDNGLTQDEIKMFKWHLGKKQLSTFLLGNLENKQDTDMRKQHDSAIRKNFIQKEERAALNCVNYCDQFSEVKVVSNGPSAA